MSILNKVPFSTRWAFNFKTWQPTEYEWCSAIMELNEEERIRIGKFRYRDDAKASLVGRLMIRKWSKQLLYACACPDIQPRLERTDKGRPQLILSPVQIESTLDLNFDFNVAHAGELTVFAAEVNKTNKFSIGVDVMPITNNRHKNVEEFLRLMKRQFTTNEWAQIKKIPSDYDEGFIETLKTFYRFWCLKESFVKAEGSGLAWNLQRLSFNCPTADLSASKILIDTFLEVDGSLLCGWQFQEHLLSPKHCVAVAVNYSDLVPEVQNLLPFEFVNFLDLLSLEVTTNTEKHSEITEMRKKQWDVFIAKEMNKPF